MRTRTKILLFGGLILAVLVLLIVRNRTAMNAPSNSNGMITARSVSVVAVKRELLNDRISVVGTINAYNDVTVLSETQGRIVKVNVEVGNAVKAGSVLVEVDSELKEAAYKAARVAYEKAQKDLARYEALYKERSIPDSQIEQARWSYQTAEAQYTVARRQLDDTKITSPIAGVVTSRPVNLGQMVMGAPQATQIANVVDLSKLKAKVSVSELDVFKLHNGDPVDITTDVFPGTTFAGTIATISSKCDEAHTYPVEVLVADSRHQLKAGMFARITFKPESSVQMLLVPRQAIIGSMQSPRLFVVKDSVAGLRAVVAIKQVGTQVALASGVNEGDEVVVDGQNNLSDGSPVIIRK
jgi:RND family efflux transporter MFP subunit